MPVLTSGGGRTVRGRPGGGGRRGGMSVARILGSFNVWLCVVVALGCTTGPAKAQADESQFIQAERVYVSMMLDTIDRAYMAAMSLDDLPTAKRRIAFLLSTPAQAPPDTIASVLVGKHPYFVRAIERYHEDPGYFEFLAGCVCTAYANAERERSAIDAPAAENTPIW